MSNQNLGWKGKTTMCDHWISKDRNFWQLGRKVQTKQNDVIMVFHQFIMLLGHTVTTTQPLKLRPPWRRRTLSSAPNIVPTLQTTRSQVKVVGGKTTLCLRVEVRRRRWRGGERGKWGSEIERVIGDSMRMLTRNIHFLADQNACR